MNESIMSELLGFEDVLKAGDERFQDRFQVGEEEIEELDYREKGEVPVARDVETGEIVWLPFGKRVRILIAAKSGEGKTLFGKTYLSRIVDIGGTVFCGSDIKNDFQSFDYESGVSQRIRRETEGVLKAEEPKIKDRDFKKDFAKTLAVPYYMLDHYDGDPSNFGEVFTVGFQDVTVNDFKELIDLESWRSESQRELMKDILSSTDSNELTWEYLFRRIDEEGGQSSEKLKRKLRPFKNNYIIGSKKESLNSVMDFEDVNLVSLGLKNVDYVDDSFVEFYSALMHRSFLEKCKKGDLKKPRVLYDDEAHEVMPSDRSTQVKEEAALAFSRKGRQAEVTTVLSSQEPHKIPSQHDKSPHDFVSPTSHALVGRGLSWPGYRTVFSAFRIYDSNDTQPLRDLTNRLKRHQFLYLDQSMESVEEVKIVEALSPLVSHPES